MRSNRYVVLVRKETDLANTARLLPSACQAAACHHKTLHRRQDQQTPLWKIDLESTHGSRPYRRFLLSTKAPNNGVRSPSTIHCKPTAHSPVSVRSTTPTLLPLDGSACWRATYLIARTTYHLCKHSEMLHPLSTICNKHVASIATTVPQRHLAIRARYPTPTRGSKPLRSLHRRAERLPTETSVGTGPYQSQLHYMAANMLCSNDSSTG